MRRASGSRRKKWFAPSSPASSPSVMTNMTSRAGAPRALIARTTSSAEATPMVSSAAPGEPATLS
jgi:hypothetical protein